MSPSDLHGLNLIHPAPASDSDSSDIISSPHFPDFAAQLDLWSTLAFQSDEPLIQNDPDDFEAEKPDDTSNDLSPPEASPTHDSLADSVPNSIVFPTSPHNGVSIPTEPTFDINSLISGFAAGNFPISATQPSLLLGSSLAQLLALQSASIAPPLSAESSVRQNESHSHHPSKRPRIRKSSASTIDDSESPSTATPLTSAEDKRRRNTAASARFRLKKKEREAALESKAKELELKVTELERECEGLRRENGWLKGLVVGVTGAAHQPAKTTSTTLITTTKDESQGD